MPILKVDTAVNSIYTSMTRGDDILVGCHDGWQSYVFPWLAPILHLLPIQVMDRFISELGGTHGMDTFRGRPDVAVKEKIG